MPKDVNELRMKLKKKFPDSPRDRYQVKNAHNSEIAKKKQQILRRGEGVTAETASTGDSDILDKAKARQNRLNILGNGAKFGDENNEVAKAEEKSKPKATTRRKTTKKAEPKPEPEVVEAEVEVEAPVEEVKE